MSNSIPILSLFFGILVNGLVYSQDHANIPYGPESRQYLDIYLAQSTSACPAPVYFDAHGNGGNISLPNSLVNSLTSNGISIVSWESLTSVSTPAQVQTGWDDAELMFSWVKANAATYNFDTANFIIGGSSRGSILSWKYGHSGDPNIKGLYMYNALPSNVWGDSTWWYPPNEVKASSPPVFFVYRREPGSSMDPIDPDIHDPNNALIIMDKYDELGIGDRDTLIHSIIDSISTDRYQYLLDFALSVIEPCGTVGINTGPAEFTRIMAYPNPFTDNIQLSGLSGDAYFVISNSLGSLVWQGKNLELLKPETLRSGVYFLTIQAETHQQTIKVMKQ